MFNVSPTTVPVGTVIFTETVVEAPNSVLLRVPSLLVSVLMTTVGAAVAVVSPTVALSLPGAEVLPLRQ